MESDAAFARCESDELTVQWSLVAPEDVTSIRMALEMGLTLQRAPAEPPPPPCPTLSPGGAEAEVGDGGEGYDDEEDEEQSGEEWEAGEGGEATSGDGSPALDERPTASVGSLLEADEWIVARLLKRRRAAAVKRPALEDVESNDDDHAWEYLVEWGGHGSHAGTASWERRGDLADRGFLPLLNDFDTSHPATQEPTSAKKQRPTKPPSSAHARARKAQAKLLRRLRAKQDEALGVLRAGFVKDADGFSLHRLFPGFDGRLDTLSALVVQLFQSANYPPIAYSVVGECQTRRAFLARLERNPALTTSVVFHGTRAPAVVPIATLGLRVPGECGVRVVNGSACGVGIYTALQPSTSMCYLDTSRVMFVCLGLRDIEGRLPRINPQQALMVQSPTVHVYFHSDLVIPVLAVKLSTRQAAVATPHLPPVLSTIERLSTVVEPPS